MNHVIIDQQIKQMKELANLSPVIGQISEMLEAPDFSMNLLGAEIAKDIGVSSRLLKLANSAFYGFPGNISTVTQALILMGIDAVQGLIVASEVFGKLPSNLHRLIGHSMMVAKVSRDLAQHLELKRTEEIATAGLLHDIGKVFLILNDKNKYRQILKKSFQQEMPLRAVEQQELGFDHAEAGYRLATHWNLPDRLKTPIRFHHSPDQATEFKIETTIVAIANSLVNAIGGGMQTNLVIESIHNTSKELLAIDPDQLIQLSESVLAMLDDAMEVKF